MAGGGHSGEGNSDWLRIERRGAAVIVTLDRPEALNALTIGMRGQLAAHLTRLGPDPMIYAVILRSAVARTFSVGGDVREMTGLAARDLPAARKGLADELTLCWIAECLSKPTISLIDGRVMGTGVGITLYNTHRVAGENYRFAMPETQIGYFPDCGVAHAFARLPHGLGFYLGLTGREIGRADALALGLVTHCIPAGRFAEIEAHLAEADPVDPVLDTRHVDPGPSPLMAEAATIARFFQADNLTQILERLRTMGDCAQLYQLVMTRRREPTVQAHALSATLLRYVRINIIESVSGGIFNPLTLVPRILTRYLSGKETCAALSMRLRVLDRVLYFPIVLGTRLVGWLDNFPLFQTLTRQIIRYAATHIWRLVHPQALADVPPMAAGNTDGRRREIVRVHPDLAAAWGLIP